jgi:DNA-binding MarR family transcriptional regulator
VRDYLLDHERLSWDQLVVRTGQELRRFAQRSAAAYGLTPTSLDVLDVLALEDAASHRDLAGRLGISPSTLTPVLDALVEAGAVLRERDQVDRRNIHVMITDFGRERLAAAVAAQRRAPSCLPAPSPEQEAALRAHLLKVLAALDDYQ